MDFLSSPDRNSEFQPFCVGTARICLRFLDVVATIDSDAPTELAQFARLFHRFALDPVTSARSDQALTHLSISICTRSDHPHLRVDSSTWRFRTPSDLHGYLLHKLLAPILERVQSHLLLHAGAMVHKRRGILLVGDSGWGKTSLTLSLIQRGFGFLSDDIAAISKADGFVYPFPRCLLIRPGTLERVGCHLPAAAVSTWLARQVVDADDVRSGCHSEPSPVAHVFLIGPSDEQLKPGAAHTVEFVVDRIDAVMLSAIRGLVDTHALAVDRASGLARITICTRTPVSTFEAVETVCSQQRVLLLDVVKRTHGPRDFSRPTCVERLGQGEGLLGTVRHYVAGHRSAALGPGGANAGARLFLHLARLLRHARFYRLQPGSLDSVTDRICELCD